MPDVIDIKPYEQSTDGRDETKRRLGIDKNEKAILYTGRIVKAKGIQS